MIKTRNIAEFTLLVPMRNEAHNIRDLIDSLALQTFRGSWKIFFIDHKSTDQTIQITKNYALQKLTAKNIKFRVLSCRSNVFRNGVPLKLAMKEVKTKLVAITDADCVLHKDWVSKMNEGLSRAPICVGKTDSYFKRAPNRVELLGDILFKNFSKLASKSKRFAMPWGPGCNLGFRREIYFLIGAFATEVPSYDMDWGWRASKRGIPIEYLSGARVFHKRRHTITGLKKQWYSYGLSEPWIFQQHLGLRKEKIRESATQHAQSAANRIIHYYRSRGAEPQLLKEVAFAYARGVKRGYNL